MMLRSHVAIAWNDWELDNEKAHWIDGRLLTERDLQYIRRQLEGIHKRQRDQRRDARRDRDGMARLGRASRAAIRGLEEAELDHVAGAGGNAAASGQSVED
jgi:hypothetical protein